VLPDIWGFDPSVFRISPREAQQMDPQQRLLLELAFEACEDGGFAPSKLAGTATGVYVGASALDYSFVGLHDPAVVDAYFATGNTLSIVANRVSYIFDLRGPSLTLDTACSSSLVALHEARHALARGEVDVALVGGVNILSSPFGFIGFSQAGMLSPTGLCRAFAAGADGYVRAEGGVVLVLKTLNKAIENGDRIHAVICGSAVNSDGRTSGISLPAETAQVELLRTAYARSGVAPDSVAYVEAHGTGTRAGDPVEAAALGKVLGQARVRPLPVGSVKTNIGHTEPASGLAGLMKAMLALEHDLAPKSLHFDKPNPNIDFTGLNLLVTGEPTTLPRDGGRRFVGVSSFGFGGTGAHVVIADPPVARKAGDAEPRVLMLSAQTEAALRALAAEYALRLDGPGESEIRHIVAVTDHRRERMSERLVLPMDEPSGLARTLARFAQSAERNAILARGSRIEGDGSIAFVFSGNGSQWSGMGRAAYDANPTFRQALAEIDSIFASLSGWSLVEELRSQSLASDLTRTHVAQPMIFAIQAASVRALAEVGIRPSITMGHSVGEVAAAEAAGVLSLPDAIRVIYNRSRLQELTLDTGSMAVIFGPRTAATALIAEIPDLSVAAHNSPQCIVVAGPSEALAKLAKLATRYKLRARRLDLAYPFHTELMWPVKRPLLESLAGLTPSAGAVPYLSTIADGILPGAAADAAYWWRNVRDPVLFQEGVERAIRMGKRVFLEIGPSATLKTHVRDVAEQLERPALIDCVLDEKTDRVGGDPFAMAAMRLLANGANVDSLWAFGPDPGAGVDLPAYPWCRVEFRFGETTESTGHLSSRPRHPLIGGRDPESALEWRTTLDTDLEPALADHRVDGQILLPGAAFVEMGLAVARDWAGDEAALSGFEILQPLIFTANASREILCRVSASTASVEIMSRPRLSKAAYATHARGKILQKPGAISLLAEPAVLAGGVDGDEIYLRAASVGLEYGAAFRRLARATIVRESLIEVELTADEHDARLGLDPARLDSCFHGLILLFEPRGNERGGAYLPIRFDEVRLIQPACRLARASIHMKRRDERLIVADFDVFDDSGRLAATLRGARFKLSRIGAASSFAQFGLVRTWIPATGELVGRARSGRLSERLASVADAEVAMPAASLLIEGWATAASYQLARRLAKDGVLDLDALIMEGRLPSGRRRWAETVFAGLEQSGLLERCGAVRRLSGEDVPTPESVLQALASQYPDRAPELLLAAGMDAALRRFSDGEADLTGPSEAAVEAHELRSPSAIGAARALAVRLDAIERREREGYALRVLLLGVGPAAFEALRFAAKQRARLTIFDPDARRLERVRLNHGGASDVSFCADLNALADAGFDLVLSAGGLSRLAGEGDTLSRLAAKCAEGALMVAVEPTPSRFCDLVLSLTEDQGGRQVRLGAERWASECTRSGLLDVDARLIDTGADSAILLTAEAPAKPEAAGGSETIALLRDGADAGGFAEALGDAFRRRGAACRLFEAKVLANADCARTFIWFAGESEGDSTARVAARCLALRDFAVGLGRAKATVFVAVPATDRPIAEAVFAFTRTLAHETPTIDIRRIQIANSSRTTAERLASVVLSNSAETDIAVDDRGVRVLRYTTPDDASANLEIVGKETRRLEKNLEGGLDKLTWRSIERKAPRAGEVEVEVVATGLNFRDVMWALSMLPDEMLEDGYAGPTLGLEFSGRVISVGSAIEHLRIGDKVVGLCGGAFSTHVVVDAAHVAPLPPTLSCDSAATVPVAFLTAYYALTSCADLKQGEWVLIHGGAGGVGLAALQIAKWRGARAMITAGSQEKRALTLALGAEHAFDSRSGSFVDEVMRATEGCGVSVVLNSLSGEAMERSFGLLEPFGRFVELGKRDYLANTPIGLRPFRRNLSYFGVDIDQLLSSRPEVAHRLFADVLALFASGDLTPLPYSVFGADQIMDAIRLMQQSGHVGKILVRPPDGSAGVKPPTRSRVFSVDPHRTHLIAGGLGGFGLAAARWLVARGARHLVLVGRSSVPNEAALQTIAGLGGQGARVRVASLDVSDGQATEALLADLARTMPPLAGVMHAAMVLDDAIVANLDEARLLKVLRPKVAGAENLDRLTRGLALEYFVLFSSVTTLIGNPGQGAYVAGNGFLEGLAFQRRSLGLPALAVAWGGIADVGVLARDSSTRDALVQRSGGKGIKAEAALNMMAEALAIDDGSGDATVVIADVNWAVARAHLPILNSPSFSRVASDASASDASSEGAVNLENLVVSLGSDEARRAVADILVEEIGRILRLPRDDVSRTKSLAEIGLDSLMGVELALALETRFGTQTALVSSVADFNVWDLTGHLLSMSGQEAQGLQIAEGLARRHLDKADRGDIVPLMSALQEKGVDLAAAIGQSASA
jgi:phthiocerol/phenolphthiocerol synthesis type-I polyketide synthase C